MKAHFLRRHDLENYLVPEEKVKGFDELTELIDSTEENSDKWYDLIDQFNEKYEQYRTEGELYSTKLYLKSGE